MPVTLNSRSLISDLLLSMQKIIDYIKTWMTVNKLKLNKTKAMSGRKSRSLSSSFLESVHLFPFLMLLKTLLVHLIFT